MGWKAFVKDYLNFTRKERIAAIIICSLILFIYLLPKLIQRSQPVDFKPEPQVLAAITAEPEKERVSEGRDPETGFRGEKHRKDDVSFAKGELFPFDPNLLEPDGWKRLGLGDKSIKTISNYISKGGRFYKPEDLKRIWGLPLGFYERVKDHIVIEKSLSHQFDKPVYNKPEKKERAFARVNVNSGDTSAFIALPGIGSKLAGRITAFRNKLGGFYSVEQVAETFGLADSSFQKIKPFLEISGEVKKISINTATKEELKIHPYIRWNLANAIVEYRNQHGNFTSIDDLKKIVLIDEKTFEKIRPYLEL
jgi:competence protein ComEA